MPKTASTRVVPVGRRGALLNDDALAHDAAALRPVALLAVGPLDAAVTAVGAEHTALRAGAGAVRGVRVRGAVVANLRAVHGAVAAVGSERAVLVAGSVRAVVDAVVAGLTRILEAVAALELAVHVARAGHQAVVGSVVARLGRLHGAVAAGRDGHVHLAVGRARARLAAVDA